MHDAFCQLFMPTEQEIEDDRKRLRAAVSELRNRMGLSQTQFGLRLGKALPTIQRWETLRPPKGPALVQLMTLAAGINETSIAEVFRTALSEELAYTVSAPKPGTDPMFSVEPGEQAEFDVLAAVLRSPALAKERKRWEKLSAPLKRQLAEAKFLRDRNEKIWEGKDLDGIRKDVDSRGIAIGSTTIDSIESLRQFVSELKEQGKGKDEIVRLIGLEQEEKS
jgi:DNA-binding transcriptional regulator YiaG